MVTVLAAVLLVAVVAAIVVLSRRGRRSRPGERPGPVPPAAAPTEPVPSLPAPSPPSPVQQPSAPPAVPSTEDDLPHDSWHARVSPAGASISAGSAQFGHLALEEGVLGFRLDDVPAPVWTVAAAEVTATHHSFFAANDLTLSSPVTGELRVTVSRERINRFVPNDFKTRRQRLYAEDFLAALMLSGATVR